MSDANLDKIIINTIVNTLGVEEDTLLPESHFQLDLNATPEEMAEIKSTLEDKLDISLPDFEPETPETVEDLKALVYDSTL